MKTHVYKGFVFEYTYDSDQDCLEVYHNGVELGTWGIIDDPIGQIEDIADVFLEGVDYAKEAGSHIIEFLEGLLEDDYISRKDKNRIRKLLIKTRGQVI